MLYKNTRYNLFRRFRLISPDTHLETARIFFEIPQTRPGRCERLSGLMVGGPFRGRDAKVLVSSLDDDVWISYVKRSLTHRRHCCHPSHHLRRSVTG